MTVILDDIKLKEEYESGMSTTELGKKYGYSNVTIGNYLKKMGIELRNPGGKEKVLSVTNLKLKEEYESGMSTVELGKKYGCCNNIIIGRLKIVNCKIRKFTNMSEEAKQKMSAARQGIPYDEWEGYVNNGKYRNTCDILKSHAQDLKDDPERLSTEFLQKMIGVKCR